MNILNVTPNTPEWLAARSRHYCASDAATVMGVSKYKTREQFLREKVSGVTPDVSAAKQRLFDGGHAAEASARPLVEQFLGEQLYPCVVTRIVDELPLLASLDGAIMDETIIWESKQYNADLARDVEAGELDPHYWAQLEHQLLVSEAEKVYFTTTDGTPERMVGMWYVSIPERRAKVIAAWKQFSEDMSNYKHVDHAPEAEKPVIEQLPALQLRIDGDVAVQSNLPAFMDLVMTRVRAITTDLVTDEDFARAKATVVFLKDGEDKVKMAMDLFLNQSASIAEVKTKVEALLADMRAKRLALDKSVTAQESSIRIKIVEQYKEEFRAHWAGLQDSLSQRIELMPHIPVDFAAAMKGKRLLSAIHDACKQALANGKLAAGDAYARIQTNMGMMREHAANHGFLFKAAADLHAIVNMDPVAAEAVVKQRISEYEVAEKKKRDDAVAADKRRNAMSEIQAIQHQVVIAQTGRLGVRAGGTVQCMQETLAETRAWIIDERFGDLADSALQAKEDAIVAIEQMIRNAEARALEVATTLPADPVSQEPAQVEQQPAEPAPQVQASAPAPAAGNVVTANFKPPTMTNGKVCQILGFTVTAEFLTSIGAPAPTKQGNANLWHDHQIMNILEVLGVHMSKVYAEQKAKYQPARTRTAA